VDRDEAAPVTDAEYQRAVREIAAEQGRCAACRARPPKLGRRQCATCIGRVAWWKRETPRGRASTRIQKRNARRRQRELARQNIEGRS
jgi:hypothetical protein